MGPSRRPTVVAASDSATLPQSEFARAPREFLARTAIVRAGISPALAETRRHFKP